MVVCNKHGSSVREHSAEESIADSVGKWAWLILRKLRC